MEWQPIETAPRSGTLTLFATRGGYVYIAPDVAPAELSRAAMDLAREGHWPDHYANAVTHWMPLPKAPNDP